jgi:hypothetical protein
MKLKEALIWGKFISLISSEMVLVYITSTLYYRLALKNFEQCVKPGGLLLVDHRNYDRILDSGYTPSKCIYYNVSKNSL